MHRDGGFVVQSVYHFCFLQLLQCFVNSLVVGRLAFPTDQADKREGLENAVPDETTTSMTSRSTFSLTARNTL